MGEGSLTIAAAETATGPRKQNHGSMDGGEDARERQTDRDRETERDRDRKRVRNRKSEINKERQTDK